MLHHLPPPHPALTTVHYPAVAHPSGNLLKAKMRQDASAPSSSIVTTSPQCSTHHSSFLIDDILGRPSTTISKTHHKSKHLRLSTGTATTTCSSTSLSSTQDIVATASTAASPPPTPTTPSSHSPPSTLPLSAHFANIKRDVSPPLLPPQQHQQSLSTSCASTSTADAQHNHLSHQQQHHHQHHQNPPPPPHPLTRPTPINPAALASPLASLYKPLFDQTALQHKPLFDQAALQQATYLQHPLGSNPHLHFHQALVNQLYTAGPYRPEFAFLDRHPGFAKRECCLTSCQAALSP